MQESGEGEGAEVEKPQADPPAECRAQQGVPSHNPWVETKRRTPNRLSHQGAPVLFNHYMACDFIILGPSFSLLTAYIQSIIKPRDVTSWILNPIHFPPCPFTTLIQATTTSCPDNSLVHYLYPFVTTHTLLYYSHSGLFQKIRTLTLTTCLKPLKGFPHLFEENPNPSHSLQCP